MESCCRKSSPLELPQPLPQPNLRDFQTSRKRKTTGYEAALQEEIDSAVRQRRQAQVAQAEHDEERRHAQQILAALIERQSQRKASASSSEDGDCEVESDSSGSSDKEPRQSRAKTRTFKAVDYSQQEKERKAAATMPKRRRPGKKALLAAAEMSQLLDAYEPPPSSSRILDS